MRASIVVLVFVFGYVSSIATKGNSKRSEGSYTPEEIADYQGYDDLRKAAFVNTAVVTNGYSTGSGLRSIAQGSAHQAHSAVGKQHAAGYQAAYIVQSTLAQSAAQSAATANAALSGKEVLLENVEKESLEAIEVLEEEINQLESTKKAASLAKATAEQAASHVAALTAALNSAQRAAERAEEAAREAEAALASQTAMTGKAKGRLDEVASRLAAAQIDFEATKEAAAKATASAEEAQGNAAAAGAYATAKLHEVAGVSNNAILSHD